MLQVSPPITAVVPSVPRRGAPSAWPRQLQPLLIIVASAVVLLVLYRLGYIRMPGSWWLKGWRGGATLVTALAALPLTWRVALWLAYRPVPFAGIPDGELPSVTVVIPAYNEGPGVANTIRTALASNYPAALLRIIVVDDGSKDSTVRHARRARWLAPDRVQVIAMPQNRGKRHALYEGFIRTTSDVVITVDSDTVLPADAIRALVAPIVVNPKVDAVAGRIDVLNRDETLITRMLAVRYRLGFDFVRAAQSMLGAVLVCPGAFSAYRVSGVRDAWDGWRDQRFLGAQCTNGDDHALTNVVLSRGRQVRYQSTAIAQTQVPATFHRLALMYLRWTRSNLRESTLWMGFMPRLARVPGRLPAVIDGVAHFLTLPARLIVLLLVWLAILAQPALLLTAISASLLTAMVYSLVLLRSERSLDAAYVIAYSVFALLTLGWLYPAALATIRQSRWLTR